MLSLASRSECRQIVVEYIMSYPAGKKVQAHLLFLTNQLQYAVPTGRQSAGQLLKELFQRLPKVHHIHYGVILFTYSLFQFLYFGCFCFYSCRKQ